MHLVDDLAAGARRRGESHGQRHPADDQDQQGDPPQYLAHGDGDLRALVYPRDATA